MSGQFIPAAEGKFDAWASNFVTHVADKPNAYEVNETEVEKLQRLLNQWEASYADAVSKRDAAHAATQVKDLHRTELEEFLRSVSRRIQVDTRVTDASRLEAGLPVHKTHRRPIAAPSTSPLGHIESTRRLEHVLAIADSETPTKKAKPFGATACEVYLAIADVPPTDPADYRLVSIVSRSLGTVTFRAEDGGKTASYLLRWLNAKGEVGPWSSIVSATVPAI